jgi:hypothetical protein
VFLLHEPHEAAERVLGDVQRGQFVGNLRPVTNDELRLQLLRVPEIIRFIRILRAVNSENSKVVYPTRAYLVSWIARILSLKNSMSRNPYAWRFIVLILLFVPSIGPLEIITS